MSNTGYLGGDVTMAERYRLRDKYLAGLPVEDLGWRNQCRCGGTQYVCWRHRWYCRVCARWVRRPKPNPDHQPRSARRD